LCRHGQKELPSKYLYDAVGSALFEAISALPEYGLTRADARLLETHAADIAARLPKSLIVAELGSGSGKKTRHLLDALSRDREITYFPIDISPAALTMVERELGLTPRIRAVPLKREYLPGLAQAAGGRTPGESLLVLFLGSTIGNFAPGAEVQFVRRLREQLQRGDALLIGADLIKPHAQMLAAYDDPAGVTAAFNLNLLARVNRELGADFEVRAFAHEVRFNEKTSTVEMHLRSLNAQTVHVPCAGIQIAFQRGETIWTEGSRKYTIADLDQLASASGFSVEARWVDEEWPFAEMLFVAV